MKVSEIAAAFDRAEQVLRRRPSGGDHPDEPVVSRWDGGVRFLTDDGRGQTIVTDLPVVLGGRDEAPPPGWLVRAALTNCLGACVAAVAAREGVELSLLEVAATSRSDTRGLLGLPDVDGALVDPGPCDLALVVRIAAPGVGAERLRALVARADALSPVNAALRLPRPVRVRVDVAS